MFSIPQCLLYAYVESRLHVNAKKTIGKFKDLRTPEQSPALE